MTAGVERGCEYRRIEARVARVEHDIDALVIREFGDRTGVGRVERARYESRIRTPLDRRRGPVAVDIGDDDVLENFGFRSRARDRGPDATGSDHENAHAFTLRSMRRACVIRAAGKEYAPHGAGARRSRH